MLFALAVLVLTGTAASASAALRLALPGFLLASYLFATGEVVLLTELLSLGKHVGGWEYATLELPLLAASVWWWNHAGRPRPPLASFDVRAALRAHPVLAALTLAVALALLYEAFLVLTVPPNTWDGLSYHLSRAAAWYDHGAVEHVRAHTTRENVLPPNGEIQVLYTFALLGRDNIAEAPQLLAQLAIMVAIYGCARRLGFVRSASLFAALLYATLTEVALEATSTQNDLVVAAPVAAAFYFLLEARERELPLAGLALGLAAGTKLTIGPAVPALLLMAALLLPPRLLLRAAAWAAAAFVLVGSYGYVLNLSEDGRPLGVSPEAESFRPELTAGGVASTSVRVLWDFVDLSGLDPPRRMQDGLERLTGDFFRAFGIDPNPPGATSTGLRVHGQAQHPRARGHLVLRPARRTAPTAMVFGFAGAGLARRTDARRAALAWSLPLFVLVVALTHRYNPWIGRFVTLPVALALPLAAVVYRRRYLSAVIAAVAIVTVACAHWSNLSKPVRMRPWSMQREAAMTIRRPDVYTAYRVVEAVVPFDADLVAVLGVDEWDYPLYGPRLARTLVEVAPERAFDAGPRYVLLGTVEQPAIPPGWDVRYLGNGWRLVERKGG